MPINGEGEFVYTALAITLLFVAATSALGGMRNLRAAGVTGSVVDYLGGAVAAAMTVWCMYLGVWVPNR